MIRGVIVVVVLALLGGCISGGPGPYPPPIEVCDHIRDATDRYTCETRIRSLAPSPAADRSNQVPVYGTVPLSGVLSWWALYYGFGFIVGALVIRDARRRQWLALRIRPIIWGSMCVVDPVLGLLAYWAIHYSRLCPRYSGPNQALERPHDQ